MSTRKASVKKRALSPDPKELRVQVGKDSSTSVAHASKRVKTAAEPQTPMPKVAEVKMDKQQDTAGSDTQAKTKPAGQVESTKAATPEPEVKISGRFDLYAMSLPFLKKVYQPAGDATVHPEELYHKILTYQAKNDRSAFIDIPEDYLEGEFESGGICDPMSEEPFEISVQEMEAVEEFAEKYGCHPRPADEWIGTGIEASLEMKGDSCGIASSSGEIAMRPLWRKGKGDEAIELYSGRFIFNVGYSRLYSKKGHGPGMDVEADFWAVRAKK